MAGIPGSVGGGIAMNAGLAVFQQREMKDVVLDFEVMDCSGQLRMLTMEDVAVKYRHTSLLDNTDLIVTCARFNGSCGESSQESPSVKIIEFFKERKRKQPIDKRTVGSTFYVLNCEHSAGWYIEQAGFKGYQIGGIKVNEKHANWLENLGYATSADVYELVELIEQRVKMMFNVILHREFRSLC